VFRDKRSLGEMEEKNFLDVYNLEGKVIGKIELDKDVFDGKVNEAVLYQAVCMYLANKRRGLASTKTRGEVSGGGRKPWRQKGTGRARHGSIRSPLWRGGGVVFGPHPRSYRYTLPHKIKIKALQSALNARLKENNLMVINEINLDKPKTKELLNMLSQLDLYKPKAKNLKLLILLDKPDLNLKKAGANIKFLEIGLAKDINALQVLDADKIIFTQKSIEQLMERFKKYN
jgi:large subunit ribosomal protein L4